MMKKKKKVFGVAARSWADFEAEELLYVDLPAQPVEVRRKFAGQEKFVWAMAKAGRRLAFAKYANISGKFESRFTLHKFTA